MKRKLRWNKNIEDTNVSTPPVKRRKQCAARSILRAATPKLIVDDDGDDEEDFDLQPSNHNRNRNHHHNHNGGRHKQRQNHNQNLRGHVAAMDEDQDEDEDDDLCQQPPQSSCAQTHNSQIGEAGENGDDDEDEDQDIDLVGGGEGQATQTPNVKSAAQRIQETQAQVDKLAAISLKLQHLCGDETIFKLVLQINKDRARLMNEVERLSTFVGDGHWCIKLRPARLNGERLFVPDVGRFTRSQYEQHRADIVRLEEEETRKQLQQQKAEEQRCRRYLLKVAEKIKQTVGRRDAHYHHGKWDTPSQEWEFKDERQRSHYGNAVTDVVNWFNTHQNTEYNDNKFGAILWSKSGTGFKPVFARVTAEEYAQREKEFTAELKAHRADAMWEVTHSNSNPIYRRVINMDI